MEKILQATGMRSRGAAAVSAVVGAAAGGGSAATGVGALAAAAGPVAIAFAAVAAAGALAILGIKAFASVIKDQAQKLEGYSGAVAGATAESEIRRELSMLRRAQRIGPDVAKWESLRGQADEKLADIGTELLNVAMKTVDTFEDEFKVGIEMLAVIAKLLENHGGSIATILKTFGSPALSIVDAVRKLLGIAENEVANKNLDDPMWDLFDQILPDRIAADRMAPAPANRRMPGQDPFARDPRIAAAGAGAAGGGP